MSRFYAGTIGECSYYLIWIIHSNVYGQKLLHKTLSSLSQLFTTHLTMSIMSKTSSNSLLTRAIKQLLLSKPNSNIIIAGDINNLNIRSVLIN